MTTDALFCSLSPDRIADLVQKMLADVLHVQQPSITKIEKRTDMYLSTLRSHIEAMGGELDVIARFPDGSVKINNFAELGAANRLNPSLVDSQNTGAATSSADAHFQAIKI